MNSLFQEFKETLTGKKKEPTKTSRAKFVVVPATIPQTLVEESAILKGETMATKNPFSYTKGVGKENKAEYKIGKATVPAAVVSRIIKAVEGKPETRKGFIIYNKLEKEYSDFLEALDKAELDYVAAFALMQEVKPKKATGQRAGKTEKTAEALAKGILKRFKGTPEDIVADFQKMTTSHEFVSELLDIIKSYQKNFGTNTTGFTKTSNRKGNPAAIKALAKARAAKK